MKQDAREDLYAVAALLADFDRALNPLPLEEQGDLSAAPSIPPPLPTVTPRNGTRSAAGGAAGRRPPSVVAPPPPAPAPSSPPVRTRSAEIPPSHAGEASTNRAGPVPRARPDASAGARRVAVGPWSPTVPPAARSTAVPAPEWGAPEVARAAAEPPSRPRASRPFRGVAPPDPPGPGRPADPPRVRAPRPAVPAAEPTATPPPDSVPEPALSGPPAPHDSARGAQTPPVTRPTMSTAGELPPPRPAPRSPAGSLRGPEHQRPASAPATPARARLAPPPLPRGTTDARRWEYTDQARALVSGASEVGAPLDAIDEATAIPAFDTAEAAIDRGGSLAELDDGEDSSGPAMSAAAPATARFWLRGGRLRVTGPVAMLARAERRLGARWGPRRGRRL